MTYSVLASNPSRMLWLLFVTVLSACQCTAFLHGLSPAARSPLFAHWHGHYRTGSRNPTNSLYRYLAATVGPNTGNNNDGPRGESVPSYPSSLPLSEALPNASGDLARKISALEVQIDAVAEEIKIVEDSLKKSIDAGEINYLRDKEKQLRDKENKLRDKENQLRDEKNKLLDKENQLREENLLLLKGSEKNPLDLCYHAF